VYSSFICSGYSQPFWKPKVRYHVNKIVPMNSSGSKFKRFHSLFVNIVTEFINALLGNSLVNLFP
jgi:hypothetical protein